MDDARRRQEDERIVLESIYGSDVKEAAAPRAWKVIVCDTRLFY